MKVIFLDRDGVINEYPGDTRYVNSWQEFKFIPGSREAIQKLSRDGFKIFVISNQAGVAKGLYSSEDLAEIDAKMNEAIRKAGGELAGIYYCLHHPSENCACRKPKPGLLEQAFKDASITASETYFVGDSFRDMQAARSFGAKSILVLSGREKLSNRRNWEFEPDYVFENLLAVSDYLCSNNG